LLGEAQHLECREHRRLRAKLQLKKEYHGQDDRELFHAEVTLCHICHYVSNERA